MNKYGFHLATIILSLLMIPTSVVAQEMQVNSQDTEQTQNTSAYTQTQLNQILAPIALYPDPLLAQILIASTYPLEIVEANRWLQNPQNAALKNGQLIAALELQNWDRSVKSLVLFPQTLQLMDNNLQWTEQLGNAFLADQSAVMDAVQSLRAQAQIAGTLQSAPSQAISTQDGDILIQPTNPDVIYVPYYDSSVAYGAWPAPDYPPFDLSDEDEDNSYGFEPGINVITSFWGWNHLDWHHRHIDIDKNQFQQISQDQASTTTAVWQHNPAHRLGVPYQSEAVRAQYQPTSEEANRNYRGYNTVPDTGLPYTKQAGIEQGPSAIETRNEQHSSAVELRAKQHSLAVETRVKQHPSAVETRIEQHPTPPVFESFSQGAAARNHAARGASSRAESNAIKSPVISSAKFGGGNSKHR